MLTRLLLLASSVLAASSASALTLPILGGPGLDQGEVCASGTLCPGTPAFSLIGTASVAGSITLNPSGPASGATSADLVVTLTSSADFGAAQLLPGTTFSVLGIPVITVPLGGGATLVVQTGPATGSAGPVNLAPALPLLASTPAVSGFTCTVGTGADQCGFSFGPGGLTVSAGALGDYDVFLGFNVNVPEPGTALLLAFGVAVLARAGRRG